LKIFLLSLLARRSWVIFPAHLLRILEMIVGFI
jgi:hypothetical protein